MARFKPKTAFAAARGRPKFRIARSDWDRIETSYGHLLAAPVRRKIRDATRKYLDWVEFEDEAATISETTARIHAIKKIAREFREVVFQRPSKIGREADYYARSLICKHMGLRFKGRDGLQNLALQVERDIANGCERALAELRREKGSGFRDGETWQWWVRTLTSILSKSQLPTQVRKDTDKAKVAEPSAFVAFMRELQACIPEAYRRSHPGSPDFDANIALSTAIVKARTVSGLKTSPIAAE
jgi:hypothetical protein